MAKKSLIGRTIYIPQMSYDGAKAMAASFKSVGINAEPSPTGNAHTLELARKYLSGDECLPESVTLGNFLRVTEKPDFDPSKTAFMMPTSNGPCRFGHYLPLAEKIFNEMGYDDILFFSPSSYGGYIEDIPDSENLVRNGLRGIIAGDIMRKLLLKTRPYELEVGSTDLLYDECLDLICDTLALPKLSPKKHMQEIVKTLTIIRDKFRDLPKDPNANPVLIGIVGEIFCRLNDFSNNYIIRLIEKYGGEAWMSDISEWVWYTNDEQELRLIKNGKKFSFSMLGHKIKNYVIAKDEHSMLSVFKEDFKGYEEPPNTREVLKRSAPYLPRDGAHGEMVMSIGRALWYLEKGAGGVIDISPFTCMNGIVTEAVYPRVSREHNNFPLRVFYFDGIAGHLESDVEVFMELARTFKKTATNGSC